MPPRIATRYELRDAHIRGTVIRFDKATGAVEYVKPTGPVVGVAADRKIMAVGPMAEDEESPGESADDGP